MGLPAIFELIKFLKKTQHLFLVLFEGVHRFCFHPLGLQLKLCIVGH